jgi:succinate dehydrogenase/fumarate reductase flavoprotein subunit
MVEQVVETDVLVVGGGMAGCFAAIKAREEGVDVTLVDKGYVGKSGQTPFAGGFAVFNPAWGHKLDEWMSLVNTVGEYVNNREWTETVFKDSYARYQDLVSWGVKFAKAPSGLHTEYSASALRGGGQRVEPTFPQILRNQAVQSGVTILDRVMVTDLIKQEGRVVGATGIPMERSDWIVFNTTAVVLCTGAGGFKPLAGWPMSNLTADGHCMAYRVGAEITGKEFLDTHQTRANNPSARGGMGPGRRPTTPPRESPPAAGPPRRRGMVNAEGDELSTRGMVVGPERYLSLEFEVHAGRAPLLRGETPMVGGAASGMSVHTTEGVWPINTTCASSVPGLYAAGDSLGTIPCGAVYTIGGSALANASVTGARAGLGAAAYASQNTHLAVDEETLKTTKQRVYAPLERKGGFTAGWVTQLLRNLMIPYFIMYIKHGDRLQATLALVEFLRDHLVPKLYATDPHGLRLVHETKNMVLNAEMRLRASLFRTESRGCHYREDYPRREDPDWLAWVVLKKEKGAMTVSKKPVPKAWWPDLSTPYEERYPVRFPGE